jgi:formylglycine-generating enzyme required for sulfatase activity
MKILIKNILLSAMFLFSCNEVKTHQTNEPVMQPEKFVPDSSLVRVFELKNGNERIPIEMIRVDAGTFMMGANAFDGEADFFEKPIHRVTLDGFFIGKYEVSQHLWKVVTGKNPSKFQGDENLPVEYVSWNEVCNFIQKLNRKTGLKFRLPSEAEWEYSAKGGKDSRHFKYSGSNFILNVAWAGYRVCKKKTHPVGLKRPNELGIYDMSGNVMEWCQDWFYTYDSIAVSNPKGKETGLMKVLRGGSWSNGVHPCRTTARMCCKVDDHKRNCGFRLAMDLN